MKVLVCGAGQVGFSIARYLSLENNDVTVIDTSPSLIQTVQDVLDVKGLVGYASHPDTLNEAEAADAEMIIAVTLSAEVNMVACQVAHSVFGIHKKIARIRNKEYRDPAWSNLFSRRIHCSSSRSNSLGFGRDHILRQSGLLSSAATTCQSM